MGRGREMKGRGREAGGDPYCRGASLMRKSPSLGPYRRPMPKALWWSEGVWLFLLSEVLL